MSRTVFGIVFIQFVLYGTCFSQEEEEEEGNSTNANTTTSEPETATTENALIDWDVYCKYQPNSYECDGKAGIGARFYYDIKMEDCKAATFGNCPHNNNQFSTLAACHEHCRESGLHKITANLTENIYCRLQYDFGTCNEYYPMWYFDMSLRSCRGFSYSGCGGNHNRFPNAQICTAVCGNAIQY